MQANPMGEARTGDDRKRKCPQASSMMVTCRPVEPGDAAVWAALRQALWPDAAPGEHQAEIARYFAGTLREPVMVLLACDGDQGPMGFVELSLRAYAEGCRSDNVAYVEGWYVVPAARGHGVGRALIEAAEDWARRQGSTELASDAELGNTASAAAHRALGFTEVGQLRCFRKRL